MSKQPPTDNKAHIRDELDLTDASWIRDEPEGATFDDCPEYAFVPHTDGVTYTVIRQAAEPDGEFLVFDPDEWEAFLKGAIDGQFDPPAETQTAP